VLKLPAPYPGLLSRLLRRTRSKVLPSYWIVLKMN
jgi:hypothetical protein